MLWAWSTLKGSPGLTYTMPVYHEERYDSAPHVTSRSQKKIRVLLGPTSSWRNRDNHAKMF